MTTHYVAVAAPPAVRTPVDLAGCGAADLIELRLDLLGTGDDVGAWIDASPRPVIATMRSREQGGAFDGSAEDAAALLREAAESGAAWIDAEEAVRPLLGELPDGVRVILSAHGVDARRPAGEADIYKIARPVADAAALAGLRREALREDTAWIPYGPLASTRVLFQPPLLYGAWDEESSVVAGQPSLAALLDELRAGEVTPEATLYALIGKPPAWSASPAMHNAVFRAGGRDALYVPLPDMNLEAALNLPFAGFSVTHPYKGDALKACATLSDDARRSGAVNTLIRNSDGGWDGDNTDVAGLRSILDPAPAHATAFVYGTGGFARAATVALTDLGYGVRLGPRDSTYEREPSDRVLVNATPSGADRGPLPWLTSALDGLVVVDAPYAAAGQETSLVHRALDDAEVVLDGAVLLHAQAHYQAALFGGESGVQATALRPPPTLVLLGARGAGKTTVGRRVATRSGRPFVDLDAEVTRVTGRTAADWIQNSGWDAFRDIESQLLERVLARRGIVLATGGGVVDSGVSRDLLRDHGFTVYLEVDPHIAAERVARDPTPRPLAPGASDAHEEAAMLITRRASAWLALADAEVDAGRSVDEVVRAVARCWGTQDVEIV